MTSVTPPVETQGLVDLAERCEAATGADRALDAAIAAAVQQMPISDPGAWLSAWPRPFELCQFKGSIAATNENGDIVCHWASREFTASLDAAMTLIPDGMQWEAGSSRHIPHSAKVWLGNGRGYVDGNSDHSRPLAIVAAALRARAAS